MKKKKKLIDKLPKEIVENILLYRLGLFKNSSFELAEIKNGVDYPQHYHKSSKAEFYFIMGEGKIILNGKEYPYTKGDIFAVKKGMKHGFKPSKDTLFLSIQTPPIKNKTSGKEDLHF